MVLLAPAASDTHPSEDQLGFFGFTPEGALIVTVPQDSAEEPKTVVVPVGYPDFRFPDNPAREGGERTQVRANLAAIRLLRALQAEGREATREEQEILARYIGWGPFPGIFIDDHPKLGAFAGELRALLTAEEWRATQASTPNANHTPPGLVRARPRPAPASRRSSAPWTPALSSAQEDAAAERGLERLQPVPDRAVDPESREHRVDAPSSGRGTAHAGPRTSPRRAPAVGGPGGAGPYAATVRRGSEGTSIPLFRLSSRQRNALIMQWFTHSLEDNY